MTYRDPLAGLRSQVAVKRAVLVDRERELTPVLLARLPEEARATIDGLRAAASVEADSLDTLAAVDAALDGILAAFDGALDQSTRLRCCADDPGLPLRPWIAPAWLIEEASQLRVRKALDGRLSLVDGEPVERWGDRGYRSHVAIEDARALFFVGLAVDPEGCGARTRGCRESIFTSASGDGGRMARMASRAFLWTTVLEVDSAERRVVFTPSRWFGALFAPAFAVTPAALLWIETQGLYQLTGGGWIIAVGYAVIAAVSAVMFLSPQNRYVALDLAQGRLVMGGPWGIGQPVEAALADVPITYTETARQHQGNTIYSGKLFATVRGRRYVVAHLANKAIDVVRLLAHLVPRAATGEDVDLRALERTVAENARGAVLRAVGIALLVVVPGVMYAISYAHR